jgi:hypothetical protein
MKWWLVLCFASVGSLAHAQGMSGTIGSGSLSIGNKLWLHENNSTDLAQPSDPIAQAKYFDYAACVCSQPNASKVIPWNQGKYSLEFDVTPDVSQVHRQLQIWVGTSCNDTLMRSMFCRQITGDLMNTTYDYPDPTINDIATMQIAGFAKPEVSVFDLLNPVIDPMNPGCKQQVLDAAEWGIADTMGTGTPDFFISTTIHADSLPPPMPTEFSGEGAESAIEISWHMPSGDVSDIVYWQALCADASGNPGSSHPPAAQYVTPRNLCGADQDVTLAAACTATDSTAPDGGCSSIALPQGLAQLDPKFLCGQAAQATALSIRLEGLQNNMPYTVVLLAVDKAGNASGVYFQNTFTPKPVVNFWQDIHNRGSDVDGGLCLLAETYGDDHPLTHALRGFRDDTLAGTRLGRWLTGMYYRWLAPLGALVHGHAVLRVLFGFLLLPIVLLALAWHYFTLPGLLLVVVVVLARKRLRLRWSRRRLVLAATAAAWLVLPAVAHAQQPYWENPVTKQDEQTPTVAPIDEPNWFVGFKLGPYIPQIDAKLGLTPGPYEQMFGSNASWMPVLDVDRVIWRGVGQVMIGGSIGVMGRTAHAWVEGSDPSDPNRPRSPGDKNSFRLVPTALLVSYRFTTLDDEYGIPLVPYARGGLSYYIWWVDAPSGDLATIDGKNKALGASLGYQGAIGLAIRAERIDADAARSMRDGGILHAGFYAELQAAKVDGFGSSKKLSVGDNTWFAGVDFEF